MIDSIIDSIDSIADNSLCSLCAKELETIKHLFCYCIYTQKLWKSFQHWLRASVVLPALTAEAAIIGKWDAEHSNSLLVNHVTLLFKLFLYINRTTSTKLIKLIFAKTLLEVH